MAIRKAEARWYGNLREGKGTMKFGSGAFEGPYSFSTRFEEAPGANPEELIGAAHAGCFSMALAGQLFKAGHTAKSISTQARVHLDSTGGSGITEIELETDVELPGIAEADFQRIAEEAKNGCPVSRALAATKITLQARLVQV